MSNPTMPLPPGMGQCSVTGKIVPQDELVTIHGQQVCAEGKAILLDRLRAGENLPGETETPGVLRRFGAIFLDGLIIGVPFAVLNAVVIAGVANTQSAASIYLMSGIMTLVSTAASVLYFGLMHAAKGQTVGKMAAGLKVVNNADNSPISSQTAFVRALLYAGPSFITGFASFSGVATAISISSMAVGVWGLINVILALVDRERQRALHDRIAGTRVVAK